MYVYVYAVAGRAAGAVVHAVEQVLEIHVGISK